MTLNPLASPRFAGTHWLLTLREATPCNKLAEAQELRSRLKDTADCYRRSHPQAKVSLEQSESGNALQVRLPNGNELRWEARLQEQEERIVQEIAITGTPGLVLHEDARLARSNRLMADLLNENVPRAEYTYTRSTDW